MIRKIIFFIAIFILIIQLNSISASCIENIHIHIKAYETYSNQEGYLSYRESPYQIISPDNFFREGDSLFIEKIRASIKPNCSYKAEVILLKFKRPGGDEFGEQIDLQLKFENSSYYELELSDYNIPGNFKDSNGNNYGITGSKKLNEVGKWELKLFLFNHTEIKDYSFINGITKKGIFIVIPRDEINVLDRIAVTELETLRQIKEDSNKTFWVSLIIIILIGVAPLIFHWIWDKKREEERQISLLESLYSELDAISSKEKKIKLIKKEIKTEGNLQWVKELFGYGLIPAHKIWNLNTQIYVGGLNSEIKGEKTKSLKSSLIHISQKIELIGNYILQYNQIPETNNPHVDNRKILRDSVIKIVDEVIELVEEANEFIKNKYGIS